MNKKYYRNIESVVKKFLNLYKRSKDKNLKKAIYSAVYRVFNEKDGLLLKKNKKEKLIVYTNDSISKEIFISGDFEFKKLYKVLRILGKKHKKKTLIDIGANIGSISIPALTRGFFRNAIAFEPEIKNYRVLNANIYLNKLENKIRPINLALSNNKKKLKLSCGKFNSGDNRIANKSIVKGRGPTQIVKTDLLDSYTKNLRKTDTLIWIDVQGHEGFVIEGAKKTMKNKIPLVMEFQPDLMQKNWFKKFSHLYNNYKYFYNLSEKKLKRNYLKEETIQKLYNKLIAEKKHTDLLIL